MAIQKAKFVNYTLEEDKDEQRKITLRMNSQEEADLEADMKILDMGVDSACIKFLVNIGRNVVRQQIPAEQLKYLVSQKRTRYDGRKRR